jgi:2-haloacid dehalogenase
MPIRALLFDVYGTLLDVYGLTDALEALAPGQGAALSALWRQRQIDYTRLRTLSDRYAPFDQLTADGLDFAAEKLGVHLTAPQRAELLRAYDTLPAHADAAPALVALGGRGLHLGALSNGSPQMLATALGAAGLSAHLPTVLSVEAVRAYKTASAAYQLGPEALGLPAGEIGFVSSNAWDAAGATWFGYRVFWVNRAPEPMERLGVTPEAEGRSLADVVRWVDGDLSNITSP